MFYNGRVQQQLRVLIINLKNMDLKKKYEEETKQKPYCWTKSGQYVKSGSYSDGYVKWLEEQLLLHNVVGRSEQLKNAEQEGYKKGWEEGAQYGYSAACEGR